MSTIQLLNYQISNRGCLKDVAFAFDLINKHSIGSYMACANPHSLVTAISDSTFSKALQSSNILLPDGSGILLAAKILCLPLREKVAGSDFFLEFSQKANAIGGMKYFFLGSSEKVLRILKKKIENEFPNIHVCGLFSPPFKPSFSKADNQEMVDIINRSKPDVLWVGLTAPKQEKWIYQHKEVLNVPFMGAIGAVFDFYAETKKRPSRFWINIGLEWLPRFLKEPIRLWERNIKSTPIFLWCILKEKIKSS